MPNVLQVVEKFKKRLVRDARVIEEANRELAPLREVFERVIELEDRIEDASLRIQRTIEMIGDRQAREALAQTTVGQKFIGQRRRVSAKHKVSLWAFMQEYLQVVKKARVNEIVEFLRAVGIDYAKRQTIESVIRRKPREFRVTKENGQKFVSLYSSWREADTAHPKPWVRG